MSTSYKGILWNRQKRIYDAVLWTYLTVKMRLDLQCLEANELILALS